MTNYELKRLTDELYWRCCDMENERDVDVIANMIACLKYASANGIKALYDEDDDTKIWDYI